MEIYYLLVCCGLFPEEQKGYHKGTRETCDLLNIYEHVLKENKGRLKKLSWFVLTTKGLMIWSRKLG